MFSFIFKNKKIISIFFIFFLVLAANSLHTTYPDEFDNILGGKLILQGILPYSGFFSHHGPLAYFFSSFIVALSGWSFVRFRLLSAVFFLGLFFISYLIIRKRAKDFGPNYFLIFIAGLAVSATYFWGQMFLADPLSGFLLVPAYTLLFLKIYFAEKLENRDLWIISLFSALSVLNSMTYLYAAIIIAVTAFVYYVRTPRNFIFFGIIFSAPYLIFLSYLIITRSFSDFLYQAIGYNRDYYIYNYPRPAGSTSFNPVRYAVVIMNNFVNAYQPLLAGFRGTDLRFPLTITLAVTNVILWIFLLVRRKFLLLVSCFLVIALINARSNPGDLRASDYQMAVYFILSLFNSVFLFFVLNREKILKPLLYVLGFFWFFSIMFLAADFWRMNYSRYMGEMPLIYDRPAVAPILNKVLTANDYCWIGPFEFEEMFYARCKAPSKYHWILPQFAGIEKIKTEIIADYTKNMPPVIVFRRDYSAFGQSSAFNEFFVRFLDDSYTRLKGYKFKDPKQKDFNFNDDFNFRKDVAPVYFQKLFDLGYLDVSK